MHNDAVNDTAKEDTTNYIIIDTDNDIAINDTANDTASGLLMILPKITSVILSMISPMEVPMILF